MHFVVITCVEQVEERGHRLCENNKGGHEPKNIEKRCFTTYGPPLNAAFSK